MSEIWWFVRYVVVGWWQNLVGAPDNSEAAQWAHVLKLRAQTNTPLPAPFPGVKIQTVDELLAEAGMPHEVDA